MVQSKKRGVYIKAACSFKRVKLKSEQNGKNILIVCVFIVCVFSDRSETYGRVGVISLIASAP